jgi:hypothetical protein
MKKVLFILAFAMFAAFSYAGYVSINSNTIVNVKTQEEPKTETTKATPSKSEKKSETAKSEKKAECSSKKAASCEKTCTKK